MRKPIDITGQQFGDLVVIKLSDKKTKNNARLWECRCVCGNIVYVLYGSLKAGHYKSCGCKQVTKRDAGLKKHIARDTIDGTRKSALKAKLHVNNKSGHKGVCWNASRQKWTVTIGFKGKQIFIGNFDTDKKEDAIIARKLAEEKYHKPYMDD
jgi:hypothetical protein